jgi:hypothetical protein
MCTAVFLGRPFTHKFDDIQRLAEWNTSNCKGSIELDAYCIENLNSVGRKCEEFKVQS